MVLISAKKMRLSLNICGARFDWCASTSAIILFANLLKCWQLNIGDGSLYDYSTAINLFI